jgi:quinoprotein dehydrogenase-associated probable ABC transporter substrate-binding protein
MSSLSRKLIFVSAGMLCAIPAAATEMRACAEPDNLPFSRKDESGFENRIARILASELHRELRYTWTAQRRGFVRKTFGADVCDVWMGVPAGFERVLTTKPYYRSTYVFIYRTRPLRSFDEAAVREMRVGVQLPGDDLAATPPGHALALRGATRNVVGFPIYGERPVGERIVDAIAAGELDAAVVWGPAAGFFAHAKQLHVVPARAPAELATLPFEFSISIGVRKGETALRDELDVALERKRAEIEAVLDEYSVPRVGDAN